MYRWVILFVVTFSYFEATEQKEQRYLLITGCGRSGTAFMNEFLYQSGLDVVHEKRAGDHGCVSWLMAADCDWAPWGPLSKDYTFEHVFHQVRDPCKVIQSFYNFPPLATWEWICTVIPEISLTDSNLVKCAKYWYYWNLMAERKAEWTYRIEDIDEAYLEMGKRLKMPLSRMVLSMVPRDTNTRGEAIREVTWDKLKEELDADLYGKVRELAKRYGYKIEG